MKIEEIDIKDVAEFYEKKIILPPGLECIKWKIYIDIVGGPENVYKLYLHMRNFKHNCYTPLYYMLKICAYKSFMQGLSPHKTSSLFNIPESSLRGHHEIFEPRLKMF